MINKNNNPFSDLVAIEIAKVDEERKRKAEKKLYHKMLLKIQHIKRARLDRKRKK